MKLKADFFDDWIKMLKDTLSNHWGYNISSIPHDEIPLFYFNAENRRPKKKARKLILADSFVCPQELSEGWEKLKKKVEDGEDLTPNLSKLIKKIKNKDSMLNDWGVHHFHLGEDMEDSFIKRTGPLLFALLVNDNFYAIGIFDHGSWANQDIVEIIHRNWPTVIENYKLRGAIDMSYHPNEKERLTLRSAGVNVYTSVSDGTIYAPIGGGVAGSRFNTQAVMRTIKQKDLLEKLEKHLDNELDSMQETFKEQGYNGDLEVEASLLITDTQYKAVFPKYNITVNLLSNL